VGVLWEPVGLVLVRCSPHGTGVAFVVRCLGSASHRVHRVSAESRHHGRSPDQTIRRSCGHQVAEILRRHHWTDFLMAAALVGRLADLLIVAIVLLMVLSAAAVAAAVAALAAEEVGVPVAVVVAEELVAEWAVAAVRVVGVGCYYSSSIDRHCWLVAGHRKAKGNHWSWSQPVSSKHPRTKVSVVRPFLFPMAADGNE
jgi:hypothetical protein